jgi:hypothetical protein
LEIIFATQAFPHDWGDLQVAVFGLAQHQPAVDNADQEPERGDAPVCDSL